ncbi:MAG TPA: malectin domain-containing carbohydrate-binding protein, partial [bacterium]|nr:malectin domain-containing carbohydrate-binding protein [bacterium]
MMLAWCLALPVHGHASAWQVDNCARGAACLDNNSTATPTASPTPTATGSPPTATNSPTLTDTPTASFTPLPGSFSLPLSVAATQPYTDSQGVVWGPDKAYNPGSFGYLSPGQAFTAAGSPISGTQDPALYQKWREAPVLEYKVDLPNGNYSVTLKWAELEYQGPGQRVFDVLAQGVTVVAGLDVAAVAGLAAALDQSFNVA